MKALFRFISWAVWLGSFSAASALAQVGTDAPPTLTAWQRLIAMSPMILMVFLIFYLLVILPQQKQLKMQEALLTSLKKGEMVLTSSGIIARVAGVENDHVLLEISNGVKVKFERSHIKFRVEKKN